MKTKLAKDLAKGDVIRTGRAIGDLLVDTVSVLRHGVHVYAEALDGTPSRRNYAHDEQVVVGGGQ